MKERKKPLYRPVNTRTHSVRHGSLLKSRMERNSRKSRENDPLIGSMHSDQRHGFDYTPLFKFLLSRVGFDWNETYSEAKSRLDREDPIFWMVAACEADRQAYVRIGESSYFSGLYVSGSGRLALVDPAIDENSLAPFCSCCTHSFNGKTFTRKYIPTSR